MTDTRIGMMTLAAMHNDRAQELQAGRQAVLSSAYAAHQRFPKGSPWPWKLPTAAWINPPEIRSTTEEGDSLIPDEMCLKVVDRPTFAWLLRYIE